MIVYEVNLRVDEALVEEYLAWLRPHIEEMLAFPGFLGAQLWTRRAEDEGDAPDDTRRFTVHYQIATREDLEAYFQGPAQRMRGDGLKRFTGRFSATRRVLHPT
ncbi:MAG: DUF4286 family protein [Myxococcota bacterium]|nr:DUF4286 family protein [Myxococcota bacterium]MEE2779767.1 DUF4286 family protein [Myxococcota bacterium]